MPLVTPQRVIEIIDASFAWAALRKPSLIPPESQSTVAMIVGLAREIPASLLPDSADAFTGFVGSLAALEGALASWRGIANPSAAAPLGVLSAFGGQSPMVVLRDALLTCPSEAPRADEIGLEFITDDALRASLRLDFTRARSALERGDFKSATVLAGSAIEALLLDVLTSLDAAALDAAHQTWKGVSKRPSDAKAPKVLEKSIERWTLHEMIWVASAAGIISEGAAAAADAARDFRNLIHPGKTRTRSPADEGTAFAAIGAALRIASELANRTAAISERLS